MAEAHQPNSPVRPGDVFIVRKRTGPRGHPEREYRVINISVSTAWCAVDPPVTTNGASSDRVRVAVTYLFSQGTRV